MLAGFRHLERALARRHEGEPIIAHAKAIAAHQTIDKTWKPKRLNYWCSSWLHHRPQNTGRSWFQAICSRVRRIENIYFGIGFLSTAAGADESLFSRDRDTIFVFGRNNKFIYSHRVDCFFVSSGVSFSRDRWLRCVGWKTWNIYSKAAIITLDFTLQSFLLVFLCRGRIGEPCSMENLFLTQFRLTSYFFITAQRWASHLPNVGSSIVRSILLLWLVGGMLGS